MHCPPPKKKCEIRHGYCLTIHRSKTNSKTQSMQVQSNDQALPTHV